MTKKSIFTNLAILLFIGSGLCSAQQSSSTTQTFDVAFKEYHVHYQESIPDYETGWMNGLHLSYKNQNQQTKEYWRLLYETTDHPDQYIGFLQDDAGNITGPYNAITKNKKTTGEIIYANPLRDADNAYAYIGIGFHNWDRKIMGSATLGVADNLEKYSWKYIPVGYRNEYQIDNKWSGATDIAIRFMFGGEMKAPSPSKIDSFQVNLGNKPGFKAEFPYSYKMNSQWSLVLNPWYEYWKIGQSNWVPQTVNGIPKYDSSGNQYVVYEPSSKTNQIGIDIGVSYTF